MFSFPPAPNNANTYLAPVVVTPGSLLITAITQSFPMRVSFTNANSNTYVAGQLIKLFIPPVYGMQQANGLIGQILSVDDVNFIFSVNIDSTNFDPFITGPINASGLPKNIQFINGFANLKNTFRLPLSSQIFPTSVSIFLGNTYTDPAGNGILVGSPTGSGSINYLSGLVQINSIPASIIGLGLALKYTFFNAQSEIPASLSCAGSRNLQFNNSSNKVAFQNLNNVGN